MEGIKSNKSLLILGVILIIVLLVLAGLFYLLMKNQETELQGQKPTKEPTKEEILKSLSAPAGPSEPVSKEVLKSLSAPSNPAPSGSAGKQQQTKISEDILKSLSAPK